MKGCQARFLNSSASKCYPKAYSTIGLREQRTTKEVEIKDKLSPMDWMLLASGLTKNVEKRMKSCENTVRK